MHESNETATEPFGDLVRDALKSIGEDDVVPLAPVPLATVGTTDPATPFRVLARLAGGELIEAGSFPSQAEARTRGEELASELAAANGRWPWIGTGFVRPELVVAIQVDPAAAV
jgi:hypothetical protein